MNYLSILYWAPRVLGVLSILFISVFALDVFQAGVPLAAILVGLFMHLIPSMILALILAAAWKYPYAGGAAFIVASLAFFFLSNQFWVNVVLCAPFSLTGALFIASAYYSAKR